MECDVIAQVIAASLQSLLAREASARMDEAAQLRTRPTQSLLDAEDVLGSLQQHGKSLRRSLRADAVILSEQGKVSAFGGFDETSPASSSLR